MGGKGSGSGHVAHKPWNNSPVIGDGGLKISDEDLSCIIRQSAMVVLWERIDNRDCKQLEERVNKYIQYCIDENVRPSNMEFYSAIGVDHRRVSEDLVRDASSERTALIKKGMEFCRVCREKIIYNGKLNPITSIFWQKNYDGLVDKQEVHVENTHTLLSQQNPDEIAQLVNDIPIDME